jgi:hypothetical protein
MPDLMAEPCPKGGEEVSSWSIGIRQPGTVAYDVQPARYPSIGAAESALAMMVVAAAESGTPLESAVFCDGRLDHEHSAPRLITGWS